MRPSLQRRANNNDNDNHDILFYHGAVQRDEYIRKVIGEKKCGDSCTRVMPDDDSRRSNYHRQGKFGYFTRMERWEGRARILWTSSPSVLQNPSTNLVRVQCAVMLMKSVRS